MNENDEALPGGSLFAGYQIVKVLGEGAFGVVYEALRQPLGKRVALKVLHKKLVSNQEVLHRFLREAQTTAQIQHPHIVETFDIGEFEGAPYLAMEFLEGEPLARRIKRDVRLTSTVAIDVMLAVFSAMSLVHGRGVIHRDLKPENIFLVKARGGAVYPKVLDFGIAKVKQADAEMALTRTTALLGTPYYMSPEQARESKHIDARSDQWALGVIFYECVTGRRPFGGTSLLELLNRIATSEYAPPTRIAPDLPAGVEAVIAQMLQRDPADRFPDVRAAGLALLPYASDAARALWSEELNSRLTLAPPMPDEVSDTVELPENAATAAASSLQGSRPERAGAPQGLAIFASSSAPRVSRGPDAALTAAMTSPPVAPSGSTLTLAARESVATPPAPSAPPSPRRWAIPAATAAVVTVLVGGAWVATRSGAATGAVSAQVSSRPMVPSVIRVSTRVTPASASIVLDQEAPVTGSIDRALPVDGREHRLVVSAPGYRREEFTFRVEFSSPEIVLARDESVSPAAPAAAPVAPAAPAEPAVAPPPPAVEVSAAEAAARRMRGHRGDAGAARARGSRPAEAAPAAPETGSNGVAIR